MKEQIKEILEQAHNGDIILLDALLKLREYKPVLECLLDDIKAFEYEYVNEIADLAGEYKNEGYKGFKISMVAGRETYNFKNISEWAEVEESKKNIEKKYKSLFKVYQNTKERPMSEEGEVYDLPEISYGKPHLRISEIKRK